MKHPLLQKINDIIMRKNYFYDQLTQLKSENNDLDLVELISFIETEIYDLSNLINLSEDYVTYLRTKDNDKEKISFWEESIQFYINMKSLFRQKLRYESVNSDKMN